MSSIVKRATIIMLNMLETITKTNQYNIMKVKFLAQWNNRRLVLGSNSNWQNTG